MDKQKIRLGIQTAWTFISNSYLTGFFSGKIYKGKLKKICVPGLNCYSCPGALGSCPIGSLQAVLNDGDHKFAFFVCGFLIFIGALTGRLVCGFLCPFGLIQELLYKIPFIKKIKTFKGDKVLRKAKYVILAVFVIILPMFITDGVSGNGTPFFCKYICPAGTLGGGIPLVLLNNALRETVGWLYVNKVAILVLTVIASLIIYRPFCKYICPLGAIYSFFNKISLYRLELDKDKCVSCGKCGDVCEMNVDPLKNCNSTECIRCGKCTQVCPTGALRSNIKNKKDN